MNFKVTAAEWNHIGWYTEERFRVIREVAAYHCLCPYCFKLVLNQETGEITELSPNCALAWSRSFEYPWALLNADLNPSDVVLDAGGGGSPFLYAVAKRVFTLINVDQNAEYLDVARNHPMYHELDNIVLVEADIRSMPFPDGHFDKVFCVSVLEHVWNWKHALAEVLRVLKAGGDLILTVDVRSEGEPGDEFFIDLDKAKELVESFGGEMPTTGSVIRYVVKGATLQVLCLKIRKGG